jgi:hypothetical protein
MERIGFKEWAAVCEALGSGRQSIILRKGGIAEGRQGFSFKHGSFFLFPTWFHEQPQKVRPDEIGQFVTAMQKLADDTVEIKYAATVETSRTVTSRDVAESLAPFHILQPEVIQERFHYDEAPGLHVAFVRVFRLQPVWQFANEKKYGGCRSWVALPETPNDLRLKPILDDNDHRKRLDEFLGIVGEPISSEQPSL